MRGLYVENGRLRYREDLPRPRAGPNECRVQVLLAGVCATDLALVRGYMGFEGVPGHEFVGLALDGPLAGRRVVGEINAACGECPACRAEDSWGERHCANRSVLGILDRGGAFAEELALPTANLHPVPEGVSDEAATFTEPLAAAFEIPEQLELAPGEHALVVGDGRLGLLCAQVLASRGLHVELAGRHPERGALFPGAGIRHLGDLAGAGTGYDLVVEATGHPAVLQEALARVRPRGRLVARPARTSSW